MPALISEDALLLNLACFVQINLSKEQFYHDLHLREAVGHQRLQGVQLTPRINSKSFITVHLKNSNTKNFKTV